MESYYDRLGDILRDRLDSDEDPFESWDPHNGKRRAAGNEKERTPPPLRKPETRRIAVPRELEGDFRILGLDSGVPADECKAAWKRLLKEHHPDAAGQSPDEQAKASLITARLTDSYRRISHWYETGAIG